MGSACFGDAWGCGCSNGGRRSRAKLGPACGEGQRGRLGNSGRPGACLGRACRTSATCRGSAAASTAASAGTATSTGNGTRRGSTRADLGSPGNIGSARRTHRSGGSDLGCCSPCAATATGTRAILGRAWSRCAGRAARPDMGLARARSQRVSSASAAVMGCAQARSSTPAGRTVLGQ